WRRSGQRGGVAGDPQQLGSRRIGQRHVLLRGRALHRLEDLVDGVERRQVLGPVDRGAVPGPLDLRTRDDARRGCTGDLRGCAPASMVGDPRRAARAARGGDDGDQRTRAPQKILRPRHPPPPEGSATYSRRSAADGWALGKVLTSRNAGKYGTGPGERPWLIFRACGWSPGGGMRSRLRVETLSGAQKIADGVLRPRNSLQDRRQEAPNPLILHSSAIFGAQGSYLKYCRANRSISVAQQPPGRTNRSRVVTRTAPSTGSTPG